MKAIRHANYLIAHREMVERMIHVAVAVAIIFGVVIML